jgi:hypothetical protein
MAGGDDYIDKVADYMIHWCRMEKGLKMEVFAESERNARMRKRKSSESKEDNNTPSKGMQLGLV